MNNMSNANRGNPKLPYRPQGGGTPRRWQTAEDMDKDWQTYLAQIEEEDSPRLLSFAIYAGIANENLCTYKDKEGFKAQYKRMKDVCEEALVKMLFDNKRRNIIGPIFALKNNHSYADKQEITSNDTGGIYVKWLEDAEARSRSLAEKNSTIEIESAPVADKTVVWDDKDD
jgi:hypothetical protein